MIQLEILNGDQAGKVCRVTRFPFRVGRSPSSDLTLEGDGLWDQHLELRFDRRRGVLVVPLTGALVSVNGEGVEETELSNSDVLGLGILELRVQLTPASQRGLRGWELLVWLGLGVVVGSQALLLYWLV